MALLGEGQGKALLVANPAAQNGNGAAAAAHAAELLRAELGEGALDLVLTEAPGHASQLAAAAGAYAAVVALGGDGVVHEVAQGLMRLPAADRPRLGLVPVGSGNDYARTLGMSPKLDQAVRQLLAAREVPADVGCCNGRYFVETLSFGVDAAIALDTVERRKRTGRTGTMLYLASGLDQLLHHLSTYRLQATLEGGEGKAPAGPAAGAGAVGAGAAPAADAAPAGAAGAPASASAFPASASASSTLGGEMFLMAVQVGPTYGGGFRICPDARIDDGLLDICIARPPLSLPYATLIFLMAKNAHHTRFKQMEFHRTPSLQLRFDHRPPVQIDGEPLIADEYSISTVPGALRVLMAQ